MAKLKGDKMSGGENVSNINQLYPNQVSITIDTLSRNKDNILKHLELYTPRQFKYKIFFENIQSNTPTKNLKKYTISFETEKGLDWFKTYLSGQGITPNSS